MMALAIFAPESRVTTFKGVQSFSIFTRENFSKSHFSGMFEKGVGSSWQNNWQKTLSN